MTTEMLRGAPVAEALNAAACKLVSSLPQKPVLAIVRVGDSQSDAAYERNAEKRCAGVGIDVRRVSLSADVPLLQFEDELRRLTEDADVSGILLLRPLPAPLENAGTFSLIPSSKDVDGITGSSGFAVYSGSGVGFAPCTARAVIEMLDFYKIPVSGKKVTVIGRSAVVGRPLSMLLLQRDATVTVCHSRSGDIREITRASDIVISACGQAERFGAEYFSPGQVVIDVGTNWNEKTQRLCGDVRAAELDGLVRAVSPVPGGVGAVTTAVLAMHTAEAAVLLRSDGKKQVL